MEELRQDWRLKREDWATELRGKISRGSLAVETVARSRSGPKGVEALLSSFLIGSWSAYETMAGDLWEAALNAHPEGLVELNGERGKKKPSQVPLSQLLKYRFDIRGKMGSILRDQFVFGSLAEIRNAYLAAFDKRSARLVETAISDDSLDALHIVRNLLVHRAGVVDEEYLKLFISFKNIPIAEIDERIVLDGEAVVGLVNPVVQKGLSLIRAVDTWLQWKPASPVYPAPFPSGS
jgi:hypothetical protein